MKQFTILIVLVISALNFVPQDPPKFVSFKSIPHGQIVADGASAAPKEKDGWFKVLSYGTTDLVVGTLTDKSSNKPKGDYKIVKQVDGASPKLDQALANKDEFENVTIQLTDVKQPASQPAGAKVNTGASQSDKPRNVTSITLRNAYLDSLKRSGTTETLYFKAEEVVKGY